MLNVGRSSSKNMLNVKAMKLPCLIAVTRYTCKVNCDKMFETYLDSEEVVISCGRNTSIILITWIIAQARNKLLLFCKRTRFTRMVNYGDKKLPLPPLAQASGCLSHPMNENNSAVDV